MPSLLSADFANLQTSIETIPSADALHVDVMDYHFVPNLTIGLPVMEAIRRITDKVLDAAVDGSGKVEFALALQG